MTTRVIDRCLPIIQVEIAHKARAKQIFGELQVVDLTTVSGTYVTVAILLAMAEESVPPGKELPFKPGEK